MSYCDQCADLLRQNRELAAERDALREDALKWRFGGEPGLATIKMQSDLIAAVAKEMREQGVELQMEPAPRIVNTRAEQAEAERDALTKLVSECRDTMRYTITRLEYHKVSTNELAGMVARVDAAIDQARQQGKKG